MVLRKIRRKSAAIRAKVKRKSAAVRKRVGSTRTGKAFSQSLKDQMKFNANLAADRRRKEIAVASRSISVEAKASNQMKRKIRSLTPAQLRQVSKAGFWGKGDLNFARAELRRRTKGSKKVKRRRKKR